MSAILHTLFPPVITPRKGRVVKPLDIRAPVVIRLTGNQYRKTFNPTNDQRIVVAFLRIDGPMRREHLVGVLNLSKNRIKAALKKLREDWLAEYFQVDGLGYWRASAMGGV